MLVLLNVAANCATGAWAAIVTVGGGVATDAVDVGSVTAGVLTSCTTLIGVSDFSLTAGAATGSSDLAATGEVAVGTVAVGAFRLLPMELWVLTALLLVH